jgi:hypothetical protein
MTKTYDFLENEMRGSSLLDSLRLLKESEDCAKLLSSAHMLRALATSMVEETDGDMERMVRDCKKMLAAKPMEGLTPTIMAERMKRIAALPKSHHINDEGRVYMARIDNPLGDGSVWCALDMSETFRKTLELCKQERKG